MRRLVLPLLLLATAACGDATAPVAVNLQYREVPVAPGAALPHVSVEGDVLGLRIYGRFNAMACGPSGATAEARGRVLHVSVLTRYGVCDLVTRPYGYELRLVALEPGPWEVRVTHEDASDEQREFRENRTVFRAVGGLFTGPWRRAG